MVECAGGKSLLETRTRRTQTGPGPLKVDRKTTRLQGVIFSIAVD